MNIFGWFKKNTTKEPAPLQKALAAIDVMIGKLGSAGLTDKQVENYTVLFDTVKKLLAGTTPARNADAIYTTLADTCDRAVPVILHSGTDEQKRNMVSWISKAAEAVIGKDDKQQQITVLRLMQVMCDAEIATAQNTRNTYEAQLRKLKGKMDQIARNDRELDTEEVVELKLIRLEHQRVEKLRDAIQVTINALKTKITALETQIDDIRFDPTAVTDLLAEIGEYIEKLPSLAEHLEALRKLGDEMDKTMAEIEGTTDVIEDTTRQLQPVLDSKTQEFAYGNKEKLTEVAAPETEKPAEEAPAEVAAEAPQTL